MVNDNGIELFPAMADAFYASLILGGLHHHYVRA
jgi:hypothetical protein